MATDQDLAYAWAAGIIDGEGCITILRQHPGQSGRINTSYRVYLKVTMGHAPTIARLVDIFQVGSVHLQRSTRWNDAFSWWVASRQAEVVLHIVRPYLVTKAVEADLAFEFFALGVGRGGGQVLPPELLAGRHRLFLAMQQAKPSHRFRISKETS
jgi:hypothetical protein